MYVKSRLSFTKSTHLYIKVIILSWTLAKLYFYVKDKEYIGGIYLEVNEMLIKLIGGLGLFLYGMKIMGDGLENAAGDRLKGF